MAERINLIKCVRESLEAAGISTVKVVHAINSDIGRTKVVKTDEKLGSGGGDAKLTKYRVTETISNKREGRLTHALWFDRWHSALEKADKIAQIPSVEIPGDLFKWAMKFHKDASKETEETPAETPQQ